MVASFLFKYKLGMGFNKIYTSGKQYLTPAPLLYAKKQIYLFRKGYLGNYVLKRKPLKRQLKYFYKLKHN